MYTLFICIHLGVLYISSLNRNLASLQVCGLNSSTRSATCILPLHVPAALTGAQKLFFLLGFAVPLKDLLSPSSPYPPSSCSISRMRTTLLPSLAWLPSLSLFLPWAFRSKAPSPLTYGRLITLISLRPRLLVMWFSMFANSLFKSLLMASCS